MTNLIKMDCFSDVEATIDRLLKRVSGPISSNGPPDRAPDFAGGARCDTETRDLFLSVFAPSVEFEVGGCPPKVRNHVLHLFRVIAILLRTEFGDRTLGHCLVHAMLKTVNWSEDQVVPFIKYVLTFPLARYSDPTNVPAKPAGFEGSAFLIGGPLGRLIRGYLNGKTRRHTSFWNSWQNLKKGCAPMQESEIYEAYLKHGVLLQKEAPELDQAVLDDYYQKFRSLWRGNKFSLGEFTSVEASKHASFGMTRARGGAARALELDLRTNFTPENGFEHFSRPEPRGASKLLWNVELDNQWGGSRADMIGDLDLSVSRRLTRHFAPDERLWDDVPDLNGHDEYGQAIIRRVANPLCFPRTSDNERKTMCALAEMQQELHVGPIPEFRFAGTKREFDRFVEEQQDQLPVLEVPKLPERFTPGHCVTTEDSFIDPDWVKVEVAELPYRIDDLIYMSLYHSSTQARAAAILESLKIRIVTCGDPYLGTLSMEVQRCMHRHLKWRSAFRLIGEPFSHEHLEALWAHPGRVGTDLVSGDYKSATDCLNIRLSKLCLKAFFDEAKGFRGDSIPDRNRLFERACELGLFEQTISYDPVVVETVNSCGTIYDKMQAPSVEQRNGQLMGGQLSFPILCVINFCCFWRAYEARQGKKFAAKDIPVLVNGDDIGFTSDEQLYATWLDELKNPGFLPSQGKNFVDSHFWMLNSKMYWRSGPTFREVKYLAVGPLVQPLAVMKRAHLETDLKSEEKERPYRDVAVTPADAFRVAVRSSRDPKMTAKDFLRYHRGELDEWSCNGRFNLFVDQALGGVGLDPRDVPGWEVKDTRFQRALALTMARAHGRVTDEPTRVGPGRIGTKGRSNCLLEGQTIARVICFPEHIECPVGWQIAEETGLQSVLNARPVPRELIRAKFVHVRPGRADKTQFETVEIPDGLRRSHIDRKILPAWRDSNTWEQAEDKLFWSRWKHLTVEPVDGLPAWCHSQELPLYTESCLEEPSHDQVGKPPNEEPPYNEYDEAAALYERLSQ